MELFKTSKILILSVMLLSSITVAAQDATLAAYKQSYIQEEKSEYAAAVASIKSIYTADSYEANLRLGWLCYLAGQLSESITYYGLATSLKPYALEPRFGMAYPAYALGKMDEVKAQYIKILEIDPQNTLANYRMGLIFYYAGSYDKAELYFEKVVNLYPFDHDSLLMFAWSKLKLQKYKEAKVLFTKVLMNTPDDASALEGLSYIK